MRSHCEEPADFCEKWSVRYHSSVWEIKIVDPRVGVGVIRLAGLLREV